MKKILLFTFIVSLAVFQVKSQDEDKQKENPFEGMTLMEAKALLQKQVQSLDAFEAMQNTVIRIGPATDNESESIEYKEDNLIVIHDIDTLKNKFNRYFQQVQFSQQMVYLKSRLKIRYSSFDLWDIDENFRDYDLPEPLIVVNKLFYADGTVVNVNDTLSYYADPTSTSHKHIDSILVDVRYYLPNKMRKISLSADNTEYMDGDSFAKLVAIDGDDAELIISNNLIKQIKIVQGISLKDKRVNKNGSNWVSVSSSKQTNSLGEINNLLKNLIANIDAKKYSTVDELTADLLSQMPKEPEEDDKVKEYRVHYFFPRAIKSLDMHYIEGVDSVNLTVVMKNEDLLSTRSKLFIIEDSETEKYGIIDTEGNWIVTPQYEGLRNTEGIFYEVSTKTSEDEDGWSRYESSHYKLDKKQKELVPLNFYIFGPLDSYLLIEKERNKNRGIADRDGNVIIPMKYNWITYYNQQDTLFVTTYYDETQGRRIEGLYDKQGKELLPEIYESIEVKKGFIYATKYDARGGKLVFNKQLKQLMKDNWTAEETFGEDNLLLVEDDSKKRFFVDTLGQIAIPNNPKYKFDDEFHFGMAVVFRYNEQTRSTSYGYIDTTGKLLIPLMYSSASRFQGKYACVSKNRQAMLIDVNNQIVKQFPDEVRYWQWSDDPKKTRYGLYNGQTYDGNGDLVKEE